MSRSSEKSHSHAFFTVGRSRTAGRSSDQQVVAGFTLIEVMIAITVTLLMMLGLAQMFKVLGDSMNKGRAGLELNNRLRGIMHRVRTDLDNVTAAARPPLAVGAGQGYLKYYEGPASDYTFANNPLLNRFGDVDDIFMATVKAKDTWFTGKVPRFIAMKKNIAIDGLKLPDDMEPVTIASQYAELVIFPQPEFSSDGSLSGFRLHYRTLLIRPDLNLDDGALPARPAEGLMVAGPEALALTEIYQMSDLSIRRFSHPPLSTSPDRISANTLEDLSNPANRFAHFMLPLDIRIWSMPVIALGDEIPLGPEPTSLLPARTRFLNSAFVLSGDRLGEDVLATNLLAFDIRAYDPSAPIIDFGGTTLRPGDPGFLSPGLQVLPGNPVQSPVAYGEFVDLNWAGKLILGTGGTYSNLQQVLVSELGGVQYNAAIGRFEPSESLFKSGAVKLLPNGNIQFSQPAYDTFTNLFESDGLLQAEIQNVGRGLVVTSLDPSGVVTIPWDRTSIDAGTDGIDNNPLFSPGIDDTTELETSPPFPVHLRGIQISIRIEDSSRKQFKQMSTVKEFVTN